MQRLSSKATVYLIDGSNFSRSFWDRGAGGGADALEAEFLEWLDGAARLEPLRSSCFRVVFDGGYRPSRARGNPAITVHFSEHESADDLLLERASFLSAEGVRCVIVSDDREIAGKASSEGALTMSCGTFYRLASAESRKERR